MRATQLKSGAGIEKVTRIPVTIRTSPGWPAFAGHDIVMVNIQDRWYEIPFLLLSDCFKLPTPKLSQRRAQPTNTSGIFGVARYAIKYRKRKRLLWQAMWRDADNKQH